MSKKITYELIDVESGRTLLSHASGHDLLLEIHQYVIDEGISYNDVAYITLRNGAKAEAELLAAGSDLRDLVEDVVYDEGMELKEDGPDGDYYTEYLDEYFHDHL